EKWSYDSGAHSSSYELQRSEAGMPRAADDDVIVDRDAQRLRGRNDHLRHVDVRARWGRIARWMIVHQDQGRRRKLERAFHNLAHIDGRVIDGAFLLHLVGDQLVFLVEEEDAETLPLIEALGSAAVVEDGVPRPEHRAPLD